MAENRDEKAGNGGSGGRSSAQSFEIKVGLAEMLKGGVIMDVTTPEQAKVAALAFELLYEKDPVEELESMLVDKERPELRAKLQRAIEGA